MRQYIQYAILPEAIKISRIHNEKQRKSKTKKIIESARRVFCQKGFVAVTMQDIIDECGISRGGIYLYFASVDEIFLEVMKQRNKESARAGGSFEEILADFFAKQKQRLLNFENSLFRAYCEYIFSKPKAAVKAFRDTQLEHLRRNVIAILGDPADENARRIADHFIVTIDGLSVLALAEALSEDVIDAQFAILNDMAERTRFHAK
ncbi:MAG: TetR/AcrR family transcriptional regulator [Defluviitaleaceae bacterium]|nr:TetR/AcrR family transcriptional regulator [Defluviitaleaceae bacterium]